MNVEQARQTAQLADDFYSHISECEALRDQEDSDANAREMLIALGDAAFVLRRCEQHGAQPHDLADMTEALMTATAAAADWAEHRYNIGPS